MKPRWWERLIVEALGSAIWLALYLLNVWVWDWPKPSPSELFLMLLLGAVAAGANFRLNRLEDRP